MKVKPTGLRRGSIALLLAGMMTAAPMCVGVAQAASALKTHKGSAGELGVTGTSGATGPKGLLGPSTRFLVQQRNLEQNAATRQAQLVNLTSFVDGTNSLTAAHKELLSTELAGETASVNEVAARVPKDATPAGLLADATQLYKDNRVFAVMTPQVNLTNRADAQLKKIATLQSELKTSSSRPIAAELVTVSSTIVAAQNIELAQVAQDWPSNEPVFTQSRAALQQSSQQIQTITNELRALSKANKSAAKSGAVGSTGPTA